MTTSAPVQSAESGVVGSASSIGTSTSVTTSSQTQSARLVTGPLPAMAYLFCNFVLDCAHQLPKHPGKCKRLHGHTYKVKVGWYGQVDPETGMGLDFHDLEYDVSMAFFARCDHFFLNEVYPGLNTTAENLAAQWLGDLRRVRAGYISVEVQEGEGGTATAY